MFGVGKQFFFLNSKKIKFVVFKFMAVVRHEGTNSLLETAREAVKILRKCAQRYEHEIYQN